MELHDLQERVFNAVGAKVDLVPDAQVSTPTGEPEDQVVVDAI